MRPKKRHAAFLFQYEKDGDKKAARQLPGGCIMLWCLLMEFLEQFCHLLFARLVLVGGSRVLVNH